MQPKPVKPPRGPYRARRPTIVLAMVDATGTVFERFPPSVAMARFVEHYWVLSAPGAGEARREILIPNGRPLLLLSFADPSTRIDPITGERDSACNALSGITTRPFVVEQVGQASYLGAQLRPYGLAALLPGEALVNQVMPIEQWLGGPGAESLSALLLAEDLGQARATALDSFLGGVLARSGCPHMPLLASVIDRIEAARGHVNIEELARQSNVTYVTLYRAFKRLVGVGPKQFSDVVRYYSFVGAVLDSGGRDSMALLASMRGYCDQAHAAKEFRKFTGVTPSTFRSTLNGIALLMHEVGAAG